MKVRELIDRLSALDPELPVALGVMGHFYGSVDHNISHGGLRIRVGSTNGIRRSAFIGHGSQFVSEISGKSE